MLQFLDIFLTIIHIVLIVFNVTGWIHYSTRKVHFIVMMMTWFSWIVPGFWFGFGYCFLTDIQWSVKAKLGESNLPASFITYALEEVTGTNFSDSLVELMTGIVFIFVTIIAVYLRYFKKK